MFTNIEEIFLSYTYLDSPKLGVYYVILFRTPLHWAAKRNQTSVVKILLDSGADRSIKNNSGQLAEELATSAELADVFGLEGRNVITEVLILMINRPIWIVPPHQTDHKFFSSC